MTASVAHRLQDKVAIVTGATTGIGRAVFDMFADAGAKVVGGARTQANLDEAVQAATARGGEATGVTADLSKDEDAAKLVEAALDTYGRVDVLVNNAGVGYSLKDTRPLSMEAIDTAPLEEWDHVMAINLGSVVSMSRHAVPAMRRNGAGSIVNVASIWGICGAADAHAYTTAKGAIVNLSRSMAVAYGPEGIRTNALCPGFIDTPMIASVVGALNDPEYAPTWNPMGRTGRPEEIAYGALFLASDEASYANGSVIVIDGGTTAVW
jgi:NAD(P)-dependent dehydrogenase (short-subunit alcohol dehydrogenase family)